MIIHCFNTIRFFFNIDFFQKTKMSFTLIVTTSTLPFLFYIISRLDRFFDFITSIMTFIVARKQCIERISAYSRTVGGDMHRAGWWLQLIQKIKEVWRCQFFLKTGNVILKSSGAHLTQQRISFSVVFWEGAPIWYYFSAGHVLTLIAVCHIRFTN